MVWIKRLVTAALLLFVAVSIVFFVVGELRTVPTNASAGTVKSPASEGHRGIVYYFHGNMRCDTCRRIEAYAEAAIRSAFPEKLNRGELSWMAINIDEPENEHFVLDYELQARSLVLSGIAQDGRKRWKKLDKIWDLVGDKDEFSSYVRNEVEAFLKEGD